MTTIANTDASKLFKDLTSMLIYILALAGKKSNNNSKEINKIKFINLI